MVFCSQFCHFQNLQPRENPFLLIFPSHKFLICKTGVKVPTLKLIHIKWLVHQWHSANGSYYHCYCSSWNGGIESVIFQVSFPQPSKLCHFEILSNEPMWWPQKEIGFSQPLHNKSQPVLRKCIEHLKESQFPLTFNGPFPWLFGIKSQHQTQASNREEVSQSSIVHDLQAAKTFTVCKAHCYLLYHVTFSIFLADRQSSISLLIL